MRRLLWGLGCVMLSLQLAGCTTVRTSTSRKPRVDQEIAGNRGFLFGRPSAAPKAPAFTDRKVYQVEIEVPPLRWKSSAELPVSPPAKTEDKAISGNRGYIFGGPKREAVKETPRTYRFDGEPVEQIYKGERQYVGPERETKTQARTYTVVKGDTLQKISQRLYGTTKKWPLIYQANSDKLKSADKVYPGQVLVIPEVGEFKK